MRRRVYVWEVPVRLTHWVNVLSIVVLCFTGYYIANPYIFVSVREPWGIYFMGSMRFLHFVFAYIFVASLLLRTYWAFVGNQWASWRGLFPFLTKEGRKNMWHAIQYYFFLRRNPPEVAGHNALAGTSYMIIVILYGLSAFTGFTLYGQLHPASIWYTLTDWATNLIPLQALRFWHHVIMYLILAFVVHHVYAAWLIDMEEGNGLMSSIFSGYKFLPREQQPDWIEQVIAQNVKQNGEASQVAKLEAQKVKVAGEKG